MDTLVLCKYIIIKFCDYIKQIIVILYGTQFGLHLNYVLPHIPLPNIIFFENNLFYIISFVKQ